MEHSDFLFWGLMAFFAVLAFGQWIAHRDEVGIKKDREKQKVMDDEIEELLEDEYLERRLRELDPDDVSDEHMEAALEECRKEEWEKYREEYFEQYLEEEWEGYWERHWQEE